MNFSAIFPSNRHSSNQRHSFNHNRCERESNYLIDSNPVQSLQTNVLTTRFSRTIFKRKKTIALFTSTAILLGALASPTIASAEEAEPSDTELASSEPTKVQDLPLPLNDLRKFAAVFGKIKHDYVEEIDDATLLKYAIRGMLSGLDPHSAYLEPSAYSDLRENTSGTFGGLGIEVGMENGFVKVIAPIDDTPAQRGGIEAGDLIIKIGDTPVKGLSLDQAVERMRGESGTPIRLTIVREGEREPIEKKLIRDIIKVTSVKTLLLDENYGYIRISQFQSQTGDDFAKGLEKLREESEALTGIIIDLRNNPGGVLQAAVDVADQMLEGGLVVYTKGRSAVGDLSFSATPGDDTNGMPVIVLINGGSASASEILAGALQDHSRAVVMGTRSFGKGSVQNVMPLDAEYGLKLTTARYYTPLGRSIQAQGIEPDIEVNRAKLSDEQENDFFRESDLAGHLSNGNDKSDTSSKPDAEKAEDLREQKLERDFQLQEALNLLKALDILRVKEQDKLSKAKAMASSANAKETQDSATEATSE